MSVAGESGGRAQQMRQKAQEMEQAAERVTDPEERQRLKEKARRLKEQSEQERGMGAGTSTPCCNSPTHAPAGGCPRDPPGARGHRPVICICSKVWSAQLVDNASSRSPTCGLGSARATSGWATSMAMPAPVALRMPLEYQLSGRLGRCVQ